MPTTVSTGLPGALVTVSFVPSGSPTCGPEPPPPSSSTTWPAPVAQWPACRVRSSTPPPGAGRPARVSGGSEPPITQGFLGPGLQPACPLAVVEMVASAKGPAAPVTPGTCLVAASCAVVARPESTVATTSAPCWAVKAWSNGAFESTTIARASTDAPVEISSTRPITTVCTRRRVRPPRTARPTGPVLMTAPALRPRPRLRQLRLRRQPRPGRRRSGRSGRRTAPPGPGYGSPGPWSGRWC